MLELKELLQVIGRSTGVATSSTVYALVSAAHIFGIALLVGAIIPVAITMLGWLRSLDAQAMGTLRRFAVSGLALCLVTGVLLISTKPAEYLVNPVVLVKLAVIATGTSHAVLFHFVHRWPNAWMSLVPVSGAVSLILWISAVLLGRWIAFSG